MTTILPSIASANQACLGGEIERLRGWPNLHFDIEDGNFVPNITFGLKTIRALRPLSCAQFDAHLMVTEPLDYISELLALDVRAIAFHWESTGYPMAVINAIRGGGGRVGIAMNPRTMVEEILPYLPLADYVLVMTSEPDGQGDQFQPMALDKLRRLREASATIEIVADGGIDRERLPSVLENGASAVVMGRAVFSAPDPGAAVRAFSGF